MLTAKELGSRQRMSGSIKRRTLDFGAATQSLPSISTAKVSKLYFSLVLTLISAFSQLCRMPLNKDMIPSCSRTLAALGAHNSPRTWSSSTHTKHLDFNRAVTTCCTRLSMLRFQLPNRGYDLVGINCCRHILDLVLSPISHFNTLQCDSIQPYSLAALSLYSSPQNVNQSILRRFPLNL